MEARSPYTEIYGIVFGSLSRRDSSSVYVYHCSLLATMVYAFWIKVLINKEMECFFVTFLLLLLLCIFVNTILSDRNGSLVTQTETTQWAFLDFVLNQKKCGT